MASAFAGMTGGYLKGIRTERIRGDGVFALTSPQLKRVAAKPRRRTELCSAGRPCLSPAQLGCAGAVFRQREP